jgi:exosortase family protein XrtF
LENYVKKYKPFLLFLAKFFLTYVLLTAVYQWYLSGYDETKNEVDSITQSVGRQSETLLRLFGNAGLDQHPSQPSMRLFYQGTYVARIIEGCNAISVMILFAAFIVAFSGKFKQTALFIIGGSILIHVLNIGRIALLCILIYHFPQHENFLHGVVFPLIIYGIVFLLWVIWVNKFSKYAKVAK